MSDGFRRRWQSATCTGQRIVRTPPPVRPSHTPEAPFRIAQLNPSSKLTAREREVAVLITHGLTNRQIAERLVIAPRTADNHVQHIFDKLGLSSRAQVAAWVVAQRLLALPSDRAG